MEHMEQTGKEQMVGRLREAICAAREETGRQADGAAIVAGGLVRIGAEISIRERGGIGVCGSYTDRVAGRLADKLRHRYTPEQLDALADACGEPEDAGTAALLAELTGEIPWLSVMHGYPFED